MGKISEHWRIIAAMIFSAVLITGAYLFARGIESPAIAEASAETALLQAIATKDSTGDGLPDWEKSLYGIPLNATTTDYFHLGMTDGQAVAQGLIVPKAIADISAATSAPSADGSFDYAAAGLPAPTEGTLTDAFAKNFFTLYLNAKQANGGVDLSDDQTNALATQAIDQFMQNLAPTPDFKTAADIKVSGSGPDALRAYAVAAEAVIRENASDATTTEMQYLQYAVLGGDGSALAHIASIAKSDRDSAIGIAALPVPAELSAADLELVNALMHIGEINSDFTRVGTDPLTTILALQQYPQATQDLGTAFIDIGNAYAAAGIVFPAGTPGASFVNLIADTAVRQQKAAKHP